MLALRFSIFDDIWVEKRRESFSSKLCEVQNNYEQADGFVYVYPGREENGIATLALEHRTLAKKQAILRII